MFSTLYLAGIHIKMKINTDFMILQRTHMQWTITGLLLVFCCHDFTSSIIANNGAISRGMASETGHCMNWYTLISRHSSSSYLIQTKTGTEVLDTEVKSGTHLASILVWLKAGTHIWLLLVWLKAGTRI